MFLSLEDVNQEEQSEKLKISRCRIYLWMENNTNLNVFLGLEYNIFV